MGYLGRVPSPVPVTAEDIPPNSITADKIKDGVIEIADVGPVLQADITNSGVAAEDAEVIALAGL